MVNPEGFYLFLAIVIPVIWWEYRKYKLRNIKSYKVAYIMENEFNLYAKAFREPYYFGSLDEYHQQLKSRVLDRLYEEGISKSFVTQSGHRSLECRSVKDWETNFSYLRYEKVFKQGAGND